MLSFATFLLRGIFPAMSENVPAFPDTTGPLQVGRNVNGQYVYWITMVQPSPETMAAYSLKVPADSHHNLLFRTIFYSTRTRFVTLR